MDTIKEFNEEVRELAKIILASSESTYVIGEGKIIKSIDKLLSRKELDKKNRLAFARIKKLYLEIGNEVNKCRTKLFEIIYSMNLN